MDQSWLIITFPGLRFNVQVWACTWVPTKLQEFLVPQHVQCIWPQPFAQVFATKSRLTALPKRISFSFVGLLVGLGRAKLDPFFTKADIFNSRTSKSGSGTLAEVWRGGGGASSDYRVWSRSFIQLPCLIITCKIHRNKKRKIGNSLELQISTGSHPLIYHVSNQKMLA